MSGRPGAGRRESLVAVALCIAGGVAVLVAVARPWQVQHVLRPPFPPRTLHLTGSELSATPRALAYVALAGALAVLATRGWARVAIGALLAVAGAGAVAAVWSVPARTGATTTGWPWIATAGAVVVAVGGLLTAVRSRRWPAMSSRYDAPAARAEGVGAATSPAADGEGAPTVSTAAPGTRQPAAVDPHVAQWEALDRGDDPTVG